MAIAIRARAATAAARPPLPARQPNEPETALAALMFFMLLAGVAIVVLAGQSGPVPTAPNQRPIEGWVGDASAAETAASTAPTPMPVPPTLVPVAAPIAAPPASAAEPVRAAPGLAVDRPARVVNTDGRGVILHSAPRKGARTPAGLLEGTPVTLLELEGSEWARVRSAQGRVGWVPTAYLAPGN